MVSANSGPITIAAPSSQTEMRTQSTSKPVRRDTFQAFVAQDAHYLGTASTIYSQMLAKAPQGGVKAITAIQDMLEDTQEEVSLHVGFAEARIHP